MCFSFSWDVTTVCSEFGRSTFSQHHQLQRGDQLQATLAHSFAAADGFRRWSPRERCRVPWKSNDVDFRCGSVSYYVVFFVWICDVCIFVGFDMVGSCYIHWKLKKRPDNIHQPFSGRCNCATSPVEQGSTTPSCELVTVNPPLSGGSVLDSHSSGWRRIMWRSARPLAARPGRMRCYCCKRCISALTLTLLQWTQGPKISQWLLMFLFDLIVAGDCRGQEVQKYPKGWTCSRTIRLLL